MRPEGRMRGLFLRWGRLWLIAALLLPVAVSAALGLLWLHERGWLLIFLAVSVALYAVLRLAQTMAQRPARPTLEATQTPPEWSAQEREALETARRTISERLSTPRPWDEMPAEAIRVVEAVAASLSGGTRGALDFTLPEGLLLIDRVALRSRAALRRNLPFSDRLSLGALIWAWRRQGQMRAAWSAGYLVWRGVRLAVHPAAGLLREVERILTRPLQEGLNDSLVADVQRLLLEEAALAAVELYSGRLKFSDDELLTLGTAEARENPRAPARPTGPVRIVVLGQTGAGKSTLINALVGETAAETGLLPTTDAPAGHSMELGGVDCLLVDTPGIDGTAQRQRLLLRQVEGADVVLWLMRANRPARGPDAALARAMADIAQQQPRRTPPPVVRVLSAADLVMPGWPFPENSLPESARHALGRALSTLPADMGAPLPGVPLAITGDGIWNLDALERALIAALPAAEATRLSRLRLRRRSALARTGEAVAQGARGLGALGRRWLARK